MAIQSIAAGKFKAECLQLLEEVYDHNMCFIVTKRGKPYAQLAPIKEESITNYFGCMEGSIVEVDASIDPIDELWNADQ